MNDNFVPREPVFEHVDKVIEEIKNAIFGDIKRIQAEMDKKIDAIVIKPLDGDESCNILA